MAQSCRNVGGSGHSKGKTGTKPVCSPQVPEEAQVLNASGLVDDHDGGAEEKAGELPPWKQGWHREYVTRVRDGWCQADARHDGHREGRAPKALKQVNPRRAQDSRSLDGEDVLESQAGTQTLCAEQRGVRYDRERAQGGDISHIPGVTLGDLRDLNDGSCCCSRRTSGGTKHRENCFAHGELLGCRAAGWSF
jgi:hypothetical protein